jgi:FkbM family methyltransferase
VADDAIQDDSFYSQFGEDRYLVEHNRVPERGVFVDVGAGDPVRFSNSLYFEQRGWTGLCIDADPKQVEALRRVRSCLVEWAAVTSVAGEIQLLQCDEPDFSTTLTHLPEVVVAKGWGLAPIRVPGARLGRLLEKHGVERIDLLSIDTEGTELDVCSSLDWQKHQPSIVIIEHYTLGRPPQEAAIRDYFVQLPYRLIHRAVCNLVFAETRLP